MTGEKSLEEICNIAKIALAKEADEVRKTNGESVKNIQEFLSKLQGLELPAEVVAPIIVAAVKESVLANITDASNKIDSIRSIPYETYLWKCREIYKGDSFNKLNSSVTRGLEALKKEEAVIYDPVTGCISVPDVKFGKIKITKKSETPVEKSAESDIANIARQFDEQMKYATKPQAELLLDILTEDAESTATTYRRNAKIDSPAWKTATAIGSALNCTDPENIDEETLVAKITYFSLGENMMGDLKNKIKGDVSLLFESPRYENDCRKRKKDAKKEVNYLKNPYPDFKDSFLEQDVSSGKLKLSKRLKEKFYKDNAKLCPLSQDEEKIIDAIKELKYENGFNKYGLNPNVTYSQSVQQKPAKIKKKEIPYGRIILTAALIGSLGMAYLNREKVQDSLDYVKHVAVPSLNQKINQILNQK
jgi:hypothetical protein